MSSAKRLKMQREYSDKYQKIDSNSKIITYHDRRLCLLNVDIEMTIPQVLENLHLIFFPDVVVYMPKATWNDYWKTKLVFVDFQHPW